MPALVDKEKCIGCTRCVQVCPVDAITMNGDKALVDPEICIECGACIAECPVEAIAFADEE
ncbi:MAG: 4Fe-4S binding protein [Gammaproteobacteria bacterium]|nr:4Fe-4S binding protein [Gammaproteobacteria bacterium]